MSVLPETDNLIDLTTELNRHRRLVRALRDRSNWTKDGRWSPLMGSVNKDIFLAIDEILAGDKVSEDQQKLSI